MRNAHPAAAALRMPPPDHRTEDDVGVARLKLNQESEGGGMGPGRVSLELKRLGPSWDSGPYTQFIGVPGVHLAHNRVGTWHRFPELTMV